MKRKYSINMSVAGAIRNYSRFAPNKPSGATENGKELTNREFLAYLVIQQAKGHKCIPMSEGCANPCEKSDQCAGFDYQGGGCPGYLVEE